MQALNPPTPLPETAVVDDSISCPRLPASSCQGTGYSAVPRAKNENQTVDGAGAAETQRPTSVGPTAKRRPHRRNTAGLLRLRHDLAIRDPFEPPVPPDVPEPEPGDTVPIGNPCPVCGTIRDHWVFNPFLEASKKHHGWVIHRSRICACPGSDPHVLPDGAPKPLPHSHDQDWLDREFAQRGTRRQTFPTFRLDLQPRLKPAYQAAQSYACRFQHAEVARGVYLAGPPCTGKSHLVNAVVNAARALGHPALSLSAPHLFEYLTPDHRLDPAERPDALLRRQALRGVPVLALRNLFAAPLLPSELRELDLLLEYRESRGLTTHVTAPYEAGQIPTHIKADRALLLPLAYRLARLTDTPITLPPTTPPFTPAMARALEKNAR
jgi:DNA replication protein DnaC